MAFKSLLARNKKLFGSLDEDGDEKDAEAEKQDLKLKLPFIVVNTSKKTIVDCWLSPDRY